MLCCRLLPHTFVNAALLLLLNVTSLGAPLQPQSSPKHAIRCGLLTLGPRCLHIWSVWHIVVTWSQFKGHYIFIQKQLRTRYGPFPAEVNELTNVTSNVNGWLSVQDGGTWRSDTHNQLDLNISCRIAYVFLSYFPRLYSGLGPLVSLCCSSRPRWCPCSLFTVLIPLVWLSMCKATCKRYSARTKHTSVLTVNEKTSVVKYSEPRVVERG